MNGFDHSAMADRVFEAVCNDARRRGYEAGFPAGVMHERMSVAAAIYAASTVENVYRNGDHTILQFLDGTKVRVTWSREPGTVYDAEKAIMAGMLKRLMGSRYIQALRAFGDYVPDGLRSSCGNCEICGCRACGNWPTDDPVLCDPDGVEDPAGGEPVYCDDEDFDRARAPGPVHCDPDAAYELESGQLPPVSCERDDDDEAFDEFFHHVADEPGFGREVFLG